MIVLVLSVYDGVAQAARDWLVGYLNERTPTNLGAPLASLPRFQAAVGEIEALLHANERLLGSLAADLDAGGEAAERAGRATGLAKVVVARNVIAVAEQAVALIGNAGLTRHNPLQRHLRDALCSRIHSPQDDTILTNAGRAALEARRLTMPVEFIGMIGTSPARRPTSARGPAIDPGYLRAFAPRARAGRVRPRAHRLRVLAARRAQVAAYAAAHTERLGAPHRPPARLRRARRSPRARSRRSTSSRGGRVAVHVDHRRQRRRAAP